MIQATKSGKGSAVFKYRPEDFIVEEIHGGKACEVSNSIESFNSKKTDIVKLNLEARRDFLGFEMEKIGIDHFSALEILAKQIKRGNHQIGYAGSKDKEAWTCQKITIFDPDIENVIKFHHPFIILKNFKWEKHKLKIGDLEGNRFKVVLRDVDKDALKALNRVRNTKEVPNLFGGQRFGSLRMDNVSIGKLILKKRFEEAVFAFLIGYGEEESEEIKKAKKRLKLEKDIEKAREYFPSGLVENRVIQYLSDNKKDWLGALKIIGEKSLVIMCQSVQSRIFNDILERFIEKGIKGRTIQLLGYNSRFSEGQIGRIEREILEEHGIKLEDFDSPISFLKLKGSERNAFFEVRDIDIHIEDDEIFIPGKKTTLSFILGSGNYATTFLENFFDLRHS